MAAPLLRSTHRQRQLPVTLVDGDGRAVLHIPAQDFLGQRVLEVALHRAAQGLAP